MQHYVYIMTTVLPPADKELTEATAANGNLKKFSWYHGPLSRDEAVALLNGKSVGSFLVRKRKGGKGDYVEYVLSVSEVQKICHYIIQGVKNEMYFKIGDQRFADIPSIIEFYKKHMLDSTNLLEPVLRGGAELDPRVVINNVSNPDLTKVRAKFNFHGNDPEDLPFKKGDTLTVMRKEEDQWWLARDNTGREGMIPVPYVEVISSSATFSPSTPKTQTKNTKNNSLKDNNYEKPKEYNMQTQIPADHKGPLFAKAIHNREPNFYDNTMLGFKKDDKIEVLKAHEDGQWEGKHVESGKTGFFPFTHVILLLDN